MKQIMSHKIFAYCLVGFYALFFIFSANGTGVLRRVAPRFSHLTDMWCETRYAWHKQLLAHQAGESAKQDLSLLVPLRVWTDPHSRLSAYQNFGWPQYDLMKPVVTDAADMATKRATDVALDLVDKSLLIARLKKELLLPADRVVLRFVTWSLLPAEVQAALMGTHGNKYSPHKILSATLYQKREELASHYPCINRCDTMIRIIPLSPEESTGRDLTSIEPENSKLSEVTFSARAQFYVQSYKDFSSFTSSYRPPLRDRMFDWFYDWAEKVSGAPQIQEIKHFITLKEILPPSLSLLSSNLSELETRYKSEYEGFNSEEFSKEKEHVSCPSSTLPSESPLPPS